MNIEKNPIMVGFGLWNYTVNSDHKCNKTYSLQAYSASLTFNALFQVASVFFAVFGLKNVAPISSLLGGAAATYFQLNAFVIWDKEARISAFRKFYQNYEWEAIKRILISFAAITISSIALAILGHPIAGALALTVSMGCAYFSYYQSNIFKEPPQVLPDRNLPAILETKKLPLSLDGYDPTLERLKDGTLAKIDLFGSLIDNDGLLLTISHLFSQQKSPHYNHEVDLSFCSKVDVEGIDRLLLKFPNLTLFLRGTRLTADEVYELQSKHLDSTLHISSSLLNLFEEKIGCNICFSVGGVSFESHSFVLTSFGSPELSRDPYVVEGISHEEFLEVLKSIYRGLPLNNKFRLNGQDVTPTAISMYKNPEYSDVKIKVGDLTLRAHRSFFIGQCAYLKELFAGHLRESREAIVDLTHSLKKPKILETLIQYCYTKTLPELSVDELSDCLEILPILGLTDLLQQLDMAWKKIIERRGPQFSDFVDAHQANLLITRAACSRHMERAHGMQISLDENGHFETLTVTDSFSPFAGWETYATKPFQVSLNLDEKISSRNHKVFELIKKLPVKAIHLKGTWFDFLAFLKLNMEEKLEKLHIYGTGLGQIEASLVLRCKNLKYLNFYTYDSSVFFPLNKLQELENFRIEESKLSQMEQSLPDLRRGPVIVFNLTTFNRVGWEIDRINIMNRLLSLSLTKKRDTKGRFEFIGDWTPFSINPEYAPLLTKPWEEIHITDFSEALDDSLLKFLLESQSHLKIMSLSLSGSMKPGKLRALRKVLESCKALTSLRLTLTAFVDDFKSLFMAPSLIKDLSFYSRSFAEQVLTLDRVRPILQKCPCLETLRISNNFSKQDKKAIESEYPRIQFHFE